MIKFLPDLSNSFIAYLSSSLTNLSFLRILSFGFCTSIFFNVKKSGVPWKENILASWFGETCSFIKSISVKSFSAKAKKENVVTIHYQASLINGDVYDSSINKEPVSFPLNAPNGTIKGLHEGIELMSVGDQYRFYIPAKLAYGNTSPEGSPIPAGSTLIFVVELVKLSDLQGNQL